jgi:hypothetical protein
LEDQEDIFPVGKASRQEEKPEAFGRANPRVLHLALQDDQLLAEQRIFRNQLGSTEPKIGSRAQGE